MHCDFPPQITHKLLVDELYQKFKGHWTDLFSIKTMGFGNDGIPQNSNYNKTNHNPGI